MDAVGEKGFGISFTFGMLHLSAIFSLHDTILRHSKGVLRWMVSTLLLLRKLGMARLPLVMQDCCSLSCT